MVRGLNRSRVATILLLLFVCATALPTPGTAFQFFPGPSPNQRRQAWLKWAHKKTKKDCERLIALAKDLRVEAFKQKQHPLPAEVLERIQALEKQTRELKAAVAQVDENFLSVPVVTSAKEIKSEARELKDTFSHTLPGKAGKKLHKLAREIEKKADSVADRMSLP